MDKKIEQLLELISDIVDGPGTANDKARLVREIVDLSERWEMNFEEFLAWFPDGC